MPEGARLPQVGDALECITPHCYQTLTHYDVYHCVRGDTLVDIWPIDARSRAQTGVVPASGRWETVFRSCIAVGKAVDSAAGLRHH